MWLNAVFLAHALLSLPFAAWLLIDPVSLAHWLTGEHLPEVGELYARLYAGCLALIAGITWSARSSPSTAARRLIAIAMLCQQLLGMLISLSFGAFFFTMVFSLAMFAAFAIAYGFVLVYRPGDI